VRSLASHATTQARVTGSNRADMRDRKLIIMHSLGSDRQLTSSLTDIESAVAEKLQGGDAILREAKNL
jgi:hypothetical protein